MNQMNGAEAAVRMLQEYGVRHILGLCGDTSLPFYDALHQLDHGMTHVLTRDERSAAVHGGWIRACLGAAGYLRGAERRRRDLPAAGNRGGERIEHTGARHSSDVPVLSRGRYR